MKKNIIFCLSIIILSSCDKLKYGNVTGKDYHQPYTTIILIPQTISTGKTTMTYFISVPVFYPESYSIDVDGISTKGKHIEKKLWVSKFEYDTTKIGRFICIDNKCDERPYIRK